MEDRSWILDALILVVFSLSALIYSIGEMRIKAKSKKWKGTTTGVIAEIKKDYRSELFKNVWFEYPVFTYTVDAKTYRQEYTRVKKKPGYYALETKVSLRYNENNPNEFVLSDEFSGFSYHAYHYALGALLIFSFYILTQVFTGYFLSTYELLWEEETWTDLEDPLSSFSGIQLSNTYQYSTDNIELKTENAIAHFHQVDAKIEKKRGRKYNDYRSRYRQSAVAASKSYAENYTATAGALFEECGMEIEKERVYQSAYAGFLERVCPSDVEEPGVYSLEELYFLFTFASEAGLNSHEQREDPEESIGLSLAVTYAKLIYSIDELSYGKPLKEAVEKCYPSYVIRYVEQLNNNRQELPKYIRKDFPPFNTEAVTSVYRYTAEQYRETGSFQDALWSGAVFAGKQIESRTESDPSLLSLARYQPENNPLFDIERQVKTKKSSYTINFNSYGDALFYLNDWENFLLKLEEKKFDGP